jgi:DNA-binding transcriptional regulator YhcF (GntR family)/DNA-binding CsgD family transcriptional regulator
LVAPLKYLHLALFATSMWAGNMESMTANGHADHPAPETFAPGAGLRAAGLSELEERLYRTLLRVRQGSLAQLAAFADCSPVVTRRALHRLESLGLINRQGTPGRFVPAAPDTAIEALILRRQEELERCRLTAAALAAEYRNATSDTADLVELVKGESIFQRYVQLLTSARSEVLMFDKPPYIGPADNPLELEVLARGISWRAIYAQEALELPDRIAQLRAWHAAGERARLAANVPLKLVLVDRKIALLPLTPDGHGAENTAILVHPSSLLTTLLMLFDTVWERALPLDAGSRPERVLDEPAAEDRMLLQMLTAGLKDQAIARQLDVSLRTARRRLAQLMTTTGATSRFQLALAAVRRGWLPAEPLSVISPATTGSPGTQPAAPRGTVPGPRPAADDRSGARS